MSEISGPSPVVTSAFNFFFLLVQHSLNSNISKSLFDPVPYSDFRLMNMSSTFKSWSFSVLITIHLEHYPQLPYLSSKLLRPLLMHKLIIRHLTSKHLYEMGLIENFR